MGSRRMAAALAAIVVAAGAIGCGSSGPDDDEPATGTNAAAQTTAAVTPTGPPLSDAEFRAEASRICRAVMQRSFRIPFPARPEDYVAWGAGQEEIQDERIAQLSAINPPEQKQEQVAEMLEHLQTMRDQTRGLSAKMASGVTADRLGAEGQANIDEILIVRRLAIRLDIPDCQT